MSLKPGALDASLREALRKSVNVVASPAKMRQALLMIDRVCDGTMTPDAKLELIRKIVREQLPEA